MPLDLSYAPKTFNRILKKISSHLDYDKVYIDDISVFSISRNDHETDLNEVHKIIDETGFRLNHEKCKYYLEEIKFLGRIINKDGIKIDRESLYNSLLNRIPRAKKQLQRLIGILNWLRPFLKGFSTTMVPLNKKLRDRKFTLTNEDEHIIAKIIEEIGNSDTFYHSDIENHTSCTQMPRMSVLDQF